MNVFTANIFNYKIKVHYNHGGPLWFWSKYGRRLARRVSYFVNDQYGSKIHSGYDDIYVRLVSHEQFASFRLHGEIQNGQVDVCDSNNAPFYMFEKCDWSDELAIILVQCAATNPRFRIMILEKVRTMLNTGRYNRKVAPFMSSFKKYRKHPFVLSYLKKERKKNNLPSLLTLLEKRLDDRAISLTKQDKILSDTVRMRDENELLKQEEGK